MSRQQTVLNGHEARVHVDRMQAALAAADYALFHQLVDEVAEDTAQASVVIAYLLGPCPRFQA